MVWSCVVMVCCVPVGRHWGCCWWERRIPLWIYTCSSWSPTGLGVSWPALSGGTTFPWDHLETRRGYCMLHRRLVKGGQIIIMTGMDKCNSIKKPWKPCLMRFHLFHPRHEPLLFTMTPAIPGVLAHQVLHESNSGFKKKTPVHLCILAYSTVSKGSQKMTTQQPHWIFWDLSLLSSSISPPSFPFSSLTWTLMSVLGKPLAEKDPGRREFLPNCLFCLSNSTSDCKSSPSHIF